MFPRHEMLDLVVVDGRARGIVVRDMVTGEIETHLADAVCWHRRLRQRLLPLDQRQGLQRHRHLARLQEGRRIRQSLLHPDPPDLHPGHRRVPVQAHADERVAAQRRPHLGAEGQGRQAPAREIPEDERDYYLERKYPSFGNLAPRDIASRAAKQRLRRGPRRRPGGARRLPRFRGRHRTPRPGQIAEKYGNLFEMYEQITDEDPYKVPMRIYPPSHYTMGGLWVDYNLMSTIPGLFVLGEANFSDHGANRLGARALMQGLADGYFILPYTIGNYLAARSSTRSPPTTPSSSAAEAAAEAHEAAARRSRASAPSTLPPRARQDHVGALRHGAEQEGPREGAREIPELREEFWKNVQRPGSGARAQPVARAGGPRGRLPRVRRAHVPRRARPRRVLRRALPRGAPDARRRGERDDETSATSPPGSTGRRAEARVRHWSRCVYENVARSPMRSYK